ncbi:hypothetical protein PUMCH_001536 [Australozyma saopauloensis]|uniref:Transcriptional regulatory protein RXT2 N-terminal domain-containing protein n=1 Tax=Australozyma saopauloensis TaxID=291208 RepID=A0AAX4H798_9ASCO|nr:hypothetical protein PUMCH_001536 [[Candida] saopauloensis]
MLDGRSLDVIAKFKLALLTRAEKPAARTELPESNRGQKLHNTNSGSTALTSKIVDYGGNTHLVLTNDVIERTNFRNKRRWLDYYNAKNGNDVSLEDDMDSSDERNVSDEQDDADADENPLKKLRLSEILAPLAHPSEVATHPAISKTYKLPCLATLALDLIHSIEIEQKTLNQFNKLLQVLDGEDWFYQVEDNMDLPVYDHGLDESLNCNVSGIFDEKDVRLNGQQAPGVNGQSQSQGQSSHQSQAALQNQNQNQNHATGQGLGEDLNQNPNSDAQVPTDAAVTTTVQNGQASAQNGTVATQAKTEDDSLTYKRITRGAIAEEKIRITDPFFALPKSLAIFERQQQKQLEEDDEKDDDPLEVLKQDLRNYLQVSIQRQHECIKNLTTIRNGIVKADKYKRDLYKWGKELSEKK